MKLTPTNPPSLCDSILMPQMSHQFQVSINQKDSGIFCTQTISCEFDYVVDTLTVVVQQPMLDQGLHEIIRGICHTGATVNVDQLDGFSNMYVRLQFVGAKVIQHKFILDYAKSSIASHVVVFKIGEPVVCTTEPTNM